MPTGYTYSILEGIEFKSFVLSCAKAFGACITMRDDPADTPIPEAFKPSKYDVEQIQESKKNLEKVKKMTPEQWEKEAKNEYEKEMKSILDYRTKKNEDRVKYENMLVQVKSWEPVHKDLDGLKKFMIKQIEESIEFDCTEYPREAKRLTGEEWIKIKKETIKKNIEYHEQHQKEEEERIKERNLWIKRLRESLKGVK